MFRRKRRIVQPGAVQDLTPMIDVIFLLIIFFVLAGRITADISNDQILVPPTKSGDTWEPHDPSWSLLKLEVRRSVQESPLEGFGSTHELRLGLHDPWVLDSERGSFDAYQSLRAELDRIYSLSDSYAKDGIQLPKVMIELRADANVDYRIVQEIQQIASDSVDPYDHMKPKRHVAGLAGIRPFVNFLFTTRLPGE